MSKKKGKSWFLVFGYFWDEKAGSIDAQESFRISVYEASNYNEACREFAKQFARGVFEDILIVGVAKCGQKCPHFFHLIRPHPGAAAAFNASVKRNGIEYPSVVQ